MAQSHTKREAKSDTKQRILDSAEKLFAREGYHNTSLRAITGAAGVNLAAVNYHFGSKEALLKKVFERRLLPLNRLRRERLEAIRETARRENRRPGVEETLRAFIEPALSFRESGPGMEDFIILVGRALSEPGDTARRTFIRQMTPTFLLTFGILREALPDTPPEHLFWKLQFTIGVFSHAMRMFGKFRLVPEGIDPDVEASTLGNMILAFVTAGMKAV